jgi:hypothetical protein
MFDNRAPMKSTIVKTLLGIVIARAALIKPDIPSGLEVPPGLDVPPTVRHSKDPSGGYTNGSPLHARQEARIEQGIVECPQQVHGMPSTNCDKKEPISKVDLSLAWMLMGAVCFVMTLFYLANSKQKWIHLGTWSTLNLTLSIFVAIMIYGDLSSLVFYLVGVGKGESLATLFVAMALFLGLFLLSDLSLFYAKGHFTRTGFRKEMAAIGELMAHMTAFAAMCAFGHLQEMPSIKGNHFLVTLVVVAAGAIILILDFITEKLRDKIVMQDGQVDNDEKQWEEHAEETQNDVFGMCTGFLMMQALRLYITGEMQSVEPSEPPATVSHWQVICILLASVLCAVASFWNTKNLNRIRREWGEKLNPHFLRFMRIFNLSLSMCMGFCLLYWGDWALYTTFGFKGTRMCGLLLVALFLTAVTVMLIFGLDAVGSHLEEGRGRRSIRNLHLALGVVVGFSWEKCFDLAVEHILESAGEEHEAIYRVLVSGLSLATVLPAWLWYVIEKASPEYQQNYPRPAIKV